MIPVELVRELKAEISAAVATYKMAAEKQADKAITVYAQHINDGDFENDTYYPLIIVSIQKVEDGETAQMDGSFATVSLTFGVYGEDGEAWMDLLNIMEHVRQWLLKKRTVGKKFRLQLPTKWEAIEAQPYPFWFGYGTLKYSIAQPVEEFGETLNAIMEGD